MRRTVGGSDPYPWPYDGRLEGASVALVVVGVQQHWFDRSDHSPRVAAVLERVALAVQAVGGVVVLVQHCEPPAPVGWPAPAKPRRLPERGAAGAAAPAALGSLVASSGGPPPLLLEASGLNGFHGSRLDHELRKAGRDHLIVGGFGAELTVDTTLRGANDRGYECLVLSDGCAPIDVALGARALSSVTMSGGIFGAVGESADLLAALPTPCRRPTD
ncbi:MAG: cysteine hydrolase [Actinobacteria bacterium]|nr:cysteine hydrolase [Actinomycetota bacterium]